MAKSPIPVRAEKPDGIQKSSSSVIGNVPKSGHIQRRSAKRSMFSLHAETVYTENLLTVTTFDHQAFRLSTKMDELETIHMKYETEHLYEMAGCGSHFTWLGRYQILIAFIMLLIMNNANIFFYGLPFYEKIPEYQCMFKGNSQWVSCYPDHTCNPEKYGVMQYRTDPNDKFSFENMAQQLQLQCKSKDSIGLIGSFIFAGWGFGCMVLPPFADSYGRRRPFLGGIILQILIYPGIMLVTNIYAYYSLCFLFGVVISNYFTIGYCLYVENMPKSHQSRLGLMVQITQPLVQVLCSLYLNFISRNWLYLQEFSLGLTVVGLIAAYSFVHESPRYYLEKGEFEKAHAELKRHARYNGVPAIFDNFV